MCGWPAGESYPPAEGSPALSSTPDVSAPEEDLEEPDDVGVQLDALAGLAARQAQASSPDAADLATDDALRQDVPSADDDALDSTAAEASADQLPEQDQTEESPIEEPQAEIDPLTAPLATLAGAEVTTQLEPAVVTPLADSSPAPLQEEPETDPVQHDGAVLSDEAVVSDKAAGRAAAILRPTQLLIAAAASFQLILVLLNTAFGTDSGALSAVVLGVALLTLTAWTGAVVMFLHWVSRAHAHVAATAASKQRHGSSMSLIGWFIPIAGIVIGYRVLQDLWTGSDPSTRDNAGAAPAKARSIDLWVLGIVTAAIFGYGLPVAIGESAIWAGLATVGLLLAAFGLVSTMGVITNWQSESPSVGESVPAPEHDMESVTESAATSETVSASASGVTSDAVSVSAE